MELPNDLNVWTLDTVINLVEVHEFEPGIFDYKSVLHATGDNKNEHRDSIRRTACSMANTDGGFILFGILDRKQTVVSLEDRIIGIPIQGDLRKEFGEKIAGIQPEVYFEAVPGVLPLSNKPNRGIFVTRIPKSPRRPHMVASTGIYYRRGENGTAIPMNHYEVRDLMMYTEERLRKVILFRLEIKMFRREASRLLSQKRYNIATLATLYHIDAGTYKGLLADISGLLPPSTEIFEQLLKIAIYIDRINKLMDSMQYLDKKINIAVLTIIKFIESKKFKELNNEFKFFVRAFDEHCVLCEKNLNEIFGTIGTNNIISNNS